MESKFESLHKELKKLMAKGDLLYYAMADEQGKLPENFKKGFDGSRGQP